MIPRHYVDRHLVLEERIISYDRPIPSFKQITNENYTEFTLVTENFPVLGVLNILGDISAEKYYRKKFTLPISETTPLQIYAARALGDILTRQYNLKLVVENPNANRILPLLVKLENSEESLIVRAPGVWEKTQECKNSDTIDELIDRGPTISEYLLKMHATDAICGIIVTADNKIVAERRSQTVKNNPGGVSLPAGGCGFWEQPRDTLKRELSEELNLYQEHLELENKNPLTLVFVPKSLTLNYVYVVKTPLTFYKLRKNAETAKDRWEWEDLIPVDATPQVTRDFALNHMTGKGSKVALLAFADYLEGK